MADQVKAKTSEELDQELDDMIDKMLKKNKDYKYNEGFSEENWEEEMEKIPFFMTKPPEDGEEVSKEMAALQDLKYEDEDPTANATAYKEEGNYEYKQKNFRKAILAYTEGIKAKSEDRNLNAVLYTNRATVHFTIGNNRSALKDAIMAHKFDPKYLKAIVRGASACFGLKIFDLCKRWCEKGLEYIEPNNEKLLTLRKDATTEQKKAERDKRKAKLREKKRHAELDALMVAIKSRNIRLEKAVKTDDDDEDEDDEDDSNDDDEESRLRKKLAKLNLDPNHPTGARVQMDTDKRLYWPVLFYYPEYKQTDFIGAFCEENCFIEHFQVMFGSDPAPWDEEHKYEPYMLEVYFEDQEAGKLCSVESSCPLKKVLSDKRFVIRQGTPAFIILVKKSSFKEEFLKHCTIEKF